MESIFLDTAVLAVPNYAVDDQTAKEIFDRVTHFADLALPGIPVRLVIDTMAEELLWSAHCGPDYEQISEFVEIMGLAHVYAPRDLVQQFQTILANASRLNEVAPIAITQMSGFATDPALPDGLMPIVLGHETKRIFANVAALQTLQNSWSVGSAFHGSANTHYRTTLVAEEAAGPTPEALGTLPAQIDVIIRAFSHLRELVSLVSAERLWRQATTDADIHFAITLGALAIIQQAGAVIDVAAIKDFVIGPRFRASLINCQSLGQGRFSSTTFNVCAQLVARTCTHKIGPFGRPDQEVRDFDKALGWRVHLTKGAEGLRLMFWESQSLLEFANVEVKRQVVIEYGAKGVHASVDIGECLP